MAHTSFEIPIRSIGGKIGQKSICRTKRFHVGGETITGPNELYFKEKRNYKRYPLTHGEEHSASLFRQAEQLRKQLMTDPLEAAKWRERFDAQRLRPDPEATKCYHHFPSFVRAMLYKQLQSSETASLE